MLRAYIGREFERIEKISNNSAQQELDEYLNDPAKRATAQVSSTPQAKLTLSAFDEALAVFGLDRRSSLSELKRAYRRLSERSLPSNFSEGSGERDKAAGIHDRVQKAYDLLLPYFDPRLKRFQSLDI